MKQVYCKNCGIIITAFWTHLGSEEYYKCPECNVETVIIPTEMTEEERKIVCRYFGPIKVISYDA